MTTQELGRGSVRSCADRSVDRSSARITETALIVLMGALILLMMTQPAFGAYFAGEDFLHLGEYRRRGNSFWRAVFSPVAGAFFRPISVAIELSTFFSLTFFTLPWDPWFFHVRNFVAAVVNVWLLHRVLLHLVASRAARVIGVLVYVLSKIHLSTFGYVMTFDSILSVMLLLLTVLFLLRYIERRRASDYALVLGCCTLAFFMKDYGLAIMGVVGAVIASRGIAAESWRRDFRWWGLRLLPLPLIALAYLALRFSIVSLPSAGSPYSPQVSFDDTIRKLVVLTSTIANLSMNSADFHIVGRPGLGGWLASTFPGVTPSVEWVETTQYAGVLALLLGTLWVGRRAGLTLLIPLACIAGYYGPTLLVRSVLLHYMNEPMVGIAVLLGLCLDHARGRLLGIWAGVLILVGANGAISNYTTYYFWQDTSVRAQQVMGVLTQADHGQPIESITFVTGPLTYLSWNGILTALGAGPLVPELLGRPSLEVRFTEPSNLRTMLTSAGPADLVYDLDNGIVALSLDRLPPPPVLRAIVPPTGYAGVGVNVQPDGRSAVAMQVEGATPDTVAFMDGIRLATAYGSPEFLAAVVPDDLLARPGRREVHLANRYGDESNRVEFVVEELRRPVLRAIVPPTGYAGVGVNVQPDGRSVIALRAEDASPDTVAVMAGRRLETMYTGSELLAAVVPDDLLASRGRLDVYLSNGAGESSRLEFVVE